MPASAIAVTPANYRFDFKNVVSTGDKLSYLPISFRSRRARSGGSEGLKSPSIFLKHVDVTRMAGLIAFSIIGCSIPG